VVHWGHQTRTRRCSRVEADGPFRIALAVVLLGVAAVRVPRHVEAWARDRAGRAERFESTLNVALRSAAGLVGFAALVAWLVAPRTMAWASLPLPAWLRWVGAAVGIAGVAGLSWVHRELGRNFSGTLEVRAEQKLVTSGPYRRVRHPMYTTLYVTVLSFFLPSANWCIGIPFFTGLTAVVVSRVPREESMMAARFGDDYRRWAARSGRFLPRLRP
jgi:protein-S-isoprenylcysteine O-methyltransferase Ste14